MKTFIAYLLKFPLCFVSLHGITALTGLTGLSIWWCLPIYIVILAFYTIGDEMWRER